MLRSLAGNQMDGKSVFKTIFFSKIVTCSLDQDPESMNPDLFFKKKSFSILVKINSYIGIWFSNENKISNSKFREIGFVDSGLVVLTSDEQDVKERFWLVTSAVEVRN